jgi:hypothetical protein
LQPLLGSSVCSFLLALLCLPSFCPIPRAINMRPRVLGLLSAICYFRLSCSTYLLSPRSKPSSTYSTQLIKIRCIVYAIKNTARCITRAPHLHHTYLHELLLFASPVVADFALEPPSHHGECPLL